MLICHFVPKHKKNPDSRLININLRKDAFELDPAKALSACNALQAKVNTRGWKVLASETFTAVEKEVAAPYPCYSEPFSPLRRKACGDIPTWR